MDPIVDDVFPLDARPFDATTGDAFGFADAPTDVLIEAASDATPFNGGGPFLCFGCVCNGSVDMCYTAGGGPPPAHAPLDDAGADADDSGFGDASACDDDAGPTACVELPIDCVLQPTCACIFQHVPQNVCTCDVDPSGNGFRVDCNFP